MEKRLKKQRSHVIKKLHEYMIHFITFNLAAATLMSGTIVFSFNKITPFSIMLIFLFGLLFIVDLGLAIYSLIKKSDKLAKIVMWIFFIMLAIWLFYVIIFIVSYFNIGLKLTMDQISTNLTKREP